MGLERLLDAINFSGVVSGLTHDFYRYPARFSPLVARAAIECFTLPGDTILDPFSGGGTSLVEALALGRHAVGVDIACSRNQERRAVDSPLKREKLDDAQRLRLLSLLHGRSCRNVRLEPIKLSR